MINITEQYITKFLQKEVVFFTNPEKPFKDGKLLNFNLKDFYFTFVIKSGSTTKLVEIPYPFSVTDCGDHLKFSYTLEDFSQKNLDLLFKAKLLTPKKKNKLYNSTVVLSAIN